ncbi:MAG TPA: hypothetical protein VMV27_09500 [Candidatus Binataceae bacterium]|nr:hypothetical protein [Candidatus Binataceae bacterium]
MTAPMSIADAQRHILAEPAPVLFLDTCVLLDVLRVASERENAPHRIISAAERATAKTSSSPRQLWLLGAALLDVEWHDNLQGVLDSVTAHIARVDRSLAKLHAAVQSISSIAMDTRSHGSGFATDARPLQIGRFDLPTRLIEICERMLRSVILLSPDDEILRAANLRSMKGLKPATPGKREHPDCLIIETCFALCKSLRSRGFAERCAFVSSNKADFYGDGSPLRPHEELAGECSAINLHFALAFDHALSILYP